MKTIRLYISFVFYILAYSLLGNSNSLFIHPAPIVDFQFDPFCFGDTTYFINTTQGGVFYTWNIYKVNSNNINTDTVYTSNLVNAIFMFPNPGKYKVELIADNGHVVSIDKYVIIDSLPKANFDYNPCGSQFNNLSVCYTACLWDFGDGKTSTLNSPQHFFDVGGYYHVKLTVTNGTVTDTITLGVQGRQNGIDSTFRITILRDSVWNYMNDTGAYVRSDSVMVLFEANDTITGSFTSYHWSFSDGTVVDLYGYNGGRKVYHAFENVDVVYTVFLLARLPCANAFSSQSFSLFDHPNLNQNVNVNGVSIFPNPISESTLHIITDRKDDLTGIEILDYLSQPTSERKTANTENGYNVDVSNLSSGLYFIRVFFGNEVITKKLILE